MLFAYVCVCVSCMCWMTMPRLDACKGHPCTKAARLLNAAQSPSVLRRALDNELNTFGAGEPPTHASTLCAFIQLVGATHLPYVSVIVHRLVAVHAVDCGS